MDFIDPHIHIASRTTDDLAAMARAGCRAVAEPAFWMGYDRGSAASFHDYFRQLTEWEPKRTANYGIRHYCWMGLNAKEAENVEFAREVIALIPEMLERPNVVGIGEIGLHKCTANEVTTLRALIDLALAHRQPMVFHTPHLEDKLKGTRMILDILAGTPGIEPDRVCVDHCEEHTLPLVLEAGYWAGITLYPTTKATPERAADMVEMHGVDRLLVNSSADWGPSDPLAVPNTIDLMRRRGHDEATIRQLVWENPVTWLSNSPRFEIEGSRQPG